MIPARGYAGAVVGEQRARSPSGLHETSRSRHPLDVRDVAPRGLIIVWAGAVFGAALIASATVLVPDARLRSVVARASKCEVRQLSRLEHVEVCRHPSAGIVAQDVLADGGDLHPMSVDDRESHASHFQDLREQLHVDPAMRCLYAGDLRLVDSDQACEVALAQVVGTAQPTHRAGHIERARCGARAEPGRVTLRTNSLIHHDTASRNVPFVAR